MKATTIFAILAACAVLAACGPGEAPKATPAKATTGAPAAVEAKKEEKRETPDTHGMPGMSELFKGDDKKDEKKDEKK
jgi:hypothetical protein